MTEAEWLASEQVDDAMSWTAIHSPTWSFRKETLFFVACGQRALEIVLDERGAQLLAEFEIAALAPKESRSADYARPLAEYHAEAPHNPESVMLRVALSIVAATSLSKEAEAEGLRGFRGVAIGRISRVAQAYGTAIASKGAEWTTRPTPEECHAQANIIRDIFGNPFRPVAFSPEWRTDTALALARQMYDSREFSAMPILADALQDAGCDNDDILNHCRATQLPHVRGCWVCDLVLGKS